LRFSINPCIGFIFWRQLHTRYGATPPVLREPPERLASGKLLQEAEKGKMDVDPTSGEELEALIKKVMDQPKEVLARVRKMLDN